MPWKVKFFQNPRGDYPVKDFIKQQDEATYAKILHVIIVLRDYGPHLKLPYAKKLQGKLYELRTSGKIPVRIFYTMHKDTYYLLHAFKKKTPKIPLKDLKVALDRAKKLI